MTQGDDLKQIRDVCRKHRDAIEFALTLSVTASALCLMTLNWLPLSDVWCMPIQHWDFDKTPAWKKLMPLLSLSTKSTQGHAGSKKQ